MSVANSGVTTSRAGRAGFGLAEVLVMLVIVLTAVMGIVGVSVRVGRTVNSSHMRLAAATVASDQLEQVLARSYDQVTGGSSSADGVTMAWTVSDEQVGKAIRLVYSYELPRGLRHDTLTALRLQP